MTVTSIISEQIFVGNAAQTVFTFTFRTDDLGWLFLSYVVNLDVITLNGDQDTTPGGTITYSAPPPTGQQITITRNVPKTQLLDYTRYDPFDSESHEDALDKLTMMLQDNNRVTAEKSKSITIESPNAIEDITVFYTPVELTISSISSVLRGSGTPSIDWTLRYDDDRNAVGTEVVTGGSTTSSETTGDDITVFDNNVIPADSFVWLETTGIGGSVEMLHITFRYTETLP